MHVNEGQNCPSNHNVGPYADPDDCSSLWNCEGGCAIKSQVLMALIARVFSAALLRTILYKILFSLPTKHPRVTNMIVFQCPPEFLYLYLYLLAPSGALIAIPTYY